VLLVELDPFWLVLAPVWAGVDVAGESVDWALEPSVVCGDSVVVWVISELGAKLWVNAVAGKDWVVWTDVLKFGFNGLTGEATFVGLVTLFTHVFVVVIHPPITGCP
jgi:hypothetical protein